MNTDDEEFENEGLIDDADSYSSNDEEAENTSFDIIEEDEDDELNPQENDGLGEYIPTDLSTIEDTSSESSNNITDNFDQELSEEELNEINDGLNEEDIQDSMESDAVPELEENEVEKFEAQEKTGFEESNKNNPGGLNKKTILNTVVVFGVVLFFVSMFMPESCKQKKLMQKAKEKAQEVSLQDFKSIATNSPKEENGRLIESDEQSNEEETPPPNYTYQGDLPKDSSYPQTNQNGNTKTNQNNYYGGAVEERPDTRGDALVASISGIKGLSGTRGNYATDYEKTKEQNAKEAVSGSNIYSQYGSNLPDKSQLQSTLLSAVQAQNSQTSYTTQNDQAGKQNFHTNGTDKTGEGEWLSKNTLWQGTVFEAELTTALNTDIPGEITARVTKNVYSSQTGEYLLIPQNSILYGVYNSSISYAQSRAQIAWTKIIRPDGFTINIGNANAVDKKGAAGVKGFVNDHPMAYLKAIGLMSVFNIINQEFETSISTSQNQYAQNVMANSQEIANKLGEKLIDRAMDVQPTITKPIGTILYVLTNETLTLPPVEIPPVTQPYLRKRSWQ